MAGGPGQPVRMRAGVRQVGVSQDAYFALLDDGRLLSWARRRADAPPRLMQGVAALRGRPVGLVRDRPCARCCGMAAAAPRRGAWPTTWSAPASATAPTTTSGSDGTLWVKGLAHRGQYGDGRLAPTRRLRQHRQRRRRGEGAHRPCALPAPRRRGAWAPAATASARWARTAWATRPTAGDAIFDGARAIATGSRHSVAIRARRQPVGLGRRLRHRAAQAARGRGRRRRGRHGDAGADGRRRAVAVGWVAARRAGCNGPDMTGAAAGPCQKDIGGPDHDAGRGRARASAAPAVHRPSQALRPGRRRSRFSSPLHRA